MVYVNLQVVVAAEEHEWFAGIDITISFRELLDDGVTHVTLAAAATAPGGKKVTRNIGDTVTKTVYMHNPAADALVIVNRECPVEGAQTLDRPA